MDLTDCRDLTALQAIIFMIQFLQSSAKLSTCYAYIGVALRSALRMGLHRSFNANFSPIEAETRKRIFWVIRRMDTYVGAMLGLPRFLEDEDIDQEWPAEVDDEYITETAIIPMPQGSISVMAAFNAHTKIVQVLSKICKYVYPIKGTHSGGKGSVTYTVGYSKIRELEQDLAQWLDELPMALKPGGEASDIILRYECRSALPTKQMLNPPQSPANASHGLRTRTIAPVPPFPALCLPFVQRPKIGSKSIRMCLRLRQCLAQHHSYFHGDAQTGHIRRGVLVLHVHNLFRHRLNTLLCSREPHQSHQL
jgi:hypothetical protein